MIRIISMNRLMLNLQKQSIAAFCLILVWTMQLMAQGTGSNLLEIRRKAITDAMHQNYPVLKLTEGLNELQIAAQEFALLDSAFLSNTRDPNSGKPLLNEIFGIYPARQSDLASSMIFEQHRYYKVELYNFAFNLTTIALVDLKLQKIVRQWTLRDMQPDVPDHLKQIGLYLAVHSPQVIEALGYQPFPGNALMAETKTALNNTRCERSMHLCVAPTFIYRDKALWVIVDLTELKVAGIRWTYTGNGQEIVTERSMQNRNIMECFCDKDTAMIAGNWKVNYMLTSSDGLRVADITYKGRQVIDQAKIVDWHVSYSNTDGFGYSDAVGCPVFSQSAVIAVEPPFIDTLYDAESYVRGYRLRQLYWSRGWPAPCNYQYEQRFEFYNDGSWRFAVASLGRGCGNNGTYRPVLRIVLSGEDQEFSEYLGNGGWKTWDKENWTVQHELTSYTSENYQFRILRGDQSGFYVVPGRGNFDDGGRGDFAFSYVTLHHSEIEEGDADLPTIGPCCNDDYRQGPEKFMEPVAEFIAKGKLVFWYVPQLKNEDTKGKEYCWAESYIEDGIIKNRVFPCFAGPLFVPIK